MCGVSLAHGARLEDVWALGVLTGLSPFLYFLAQGVLEVVNHTKNGKKADFTPDDVRALDLYLSFAGAILR